MSLLEKALKKIEESKNVGNIIDREKVITNSNFVRQNNKQSNPTIPKTNNICPKCNKKSKITQDKSTNKDGIIPVAVSKIICLISLN